ncbi:MAG: DUF305 domain-containing protein [Burkholderiales bacterium]|nr:DUF305 domain-containing protein [Burkholderiales bacterium]
MNASDPKPAGNASMHSDAMAEGKDMAIKKSMDGMQQKMSSMHMTGNTDHDFALMMKEHHQGAIDMAEIELKQGKDPQVKKMATKIIAAQKKEMTEFDAWLKKHEAIMGTAQPGK